MCNPPDPPNANVDEADIGSGEKNPAQHETEKIIRQIPPLPPSDGQPEPGPPRQE
jgi:hypothetical protein